MKISQDNEEFIGTVEEIILYFRNEIVYEGKDDSIPLDDFVVNTTMIIELLEQLDDEPMENTIRVVYNPMGVLQYERWYE